MMKKEDQNEVRFAVTIGPHDMPSLVLRNPSIEEREYVRSAVMYDISNNPRYNLRTEAGAFLQSDWDDYVLVEFWRPDYAPFVQWLNDNYDEWVKFWKLNQ